MESLVSTFHLDLKLFIAQLINFGIVFAVLYWFALKPLFKIMALRTKKIEQGLRDAKESADKLDQSKAEHEAIIKAARQEAVAVIDQAVKNAELRREEMLNKAKEEIGLVINQERAKMQQEKSEVLKEIKSEVAELVIASIAKILPQKLSAEDEKDLIKSLKQ